MLNFSEQTDTHHAMPQFMKVRRQKQRKVISRSRSVCSMKAFVKCQINEDNLQGIDVREGINQFPKNSPC